MTRSIKLLSADKIARSRGTVQLADDGPGWAPGRAEALQAVLDAQSYDGHQGLGLVLADLVARAHGGRLQLTAPGGGRSGTLDVALSLGATAADAACVGPWTPTPAATAGAGLAALRSNWCSSAAALRGRSR